LGLLEEPKSLPQPKEVLKENQINLKKQGKKKEKEQFQNAFIKEGKVGWARADVEKARGALLLGLKKWSFWI